MGTHTSLNALSTPALKLPRIASPAPWTAAASPFTPDADSLILELVGRMFVAVSVSVAFVVLVPATVS
jgi:hypothetical protein